MSMSGSEQDIGISKVDTAAIVQFQWSHRGEASTTWVRAPPAQALSGKPTCQTQTSDTVSETVPCESIPTRFYTAAQRWPDIATLISVQLKYHQNTDRSPPLVPDQMWETAPPQPKIRRPFTARKPHVPAHSAREKPQRGIDFSPATESQSCKYPPPQEQRKTRAGQMRAPGASDTAVALLAELVGDRAGGGARAAAASRDGLLGSRGSQRITGAV